MQAALGVSTLPEPRSAGRDVAERLTERLPDGPPDLTLLLVSTAHGSAPAGGMAALVDAAREVLAGRVVGASVEGIVAPGVEVSDFPAALALGIRGADVEPFFVHEVAGEEAHLGEEIAARTGGVPDPDDLVCVLADSQSVDVTALAHRLPETLDGAALLGTGAAAAPRGRALLWCDGEKESDAAAGFVLRGASPQVDIVSAGHPVTAPLPVTRARGHWVLGLGGRPALEVYEETLRANDLCAPAEGPPPLLAGLVRQGGGSEALLVRNIVGIDRERGALSLPEPMFSGQALAFVVLDPEVAHRDMTARFQAAASPDAAFGLYLNCRARGASLFGEPGVEATEIANAFAGCPVAGISSAFQLAPLAPGGPPTVLTYAGALCLVPGAGSVSTRDLAAHRKPT